MKLLFISTRDVNIISNGGFQCTNRNYLSFCELFGVEEVDVINLSLNLQESFRSRFFKWVNYLGGFWPGLSRKRIATIIQKAKTAEYVFIDSSQLGILAYYLKKGKYKGQIISFFHNVEYHIQIEKLKINPLSFWRVALIKYNEKKALKYSDKIASLNIRDKKELQKLYNSQDLKHYVIPISFVDVFHENQFHSDEYVSTSPIYVFIGNGWYPNIHGIKWFIKNVLPFTDIKLQIVGMDACTLNNSFDHPRIEYLGFVPDLTSIIINADYMINPIFKGSGMKVKTCEALMYGKNIVGTKEAFEGYEIDYREVGAICQTKDDFIDTITHLYKSPMLKFNKHSRKYFLDKYSFKSTLKIFEELIQS